MNSDNESRSAPGEFFRKCATCKKPIHYGARYQVCSVSTCNRERTALAFCTVDCWDAHVPILRHREAWAVERFAPSREQALAAKEAGSASSGEAKPRRRVVSAGASTPLAKPQVSSQARDSAREKQVDPELKAAARARSFEPPPSPEVLVVASKVKAYVKARGGLNTSAAVMEALSEKVREACDEAIRSAWIHDRKTLLDRDV